MMYASLFSHVETVLYLLEIKADVHMENPSGKTPLMLASLCGSEEILKLLLQVLIPVNNAKIIFLITLWMIIAWSQP